jgi:hypothetical protein
MWCGDSGTLPAEVVEMVGCVTPQVFIKDKYLI